MNKEIHYWTYWKCVQGNGIKKECHWVRSPARRGHSRSDSIARGCKTGLLHLQLYESLITILSFSHTKYIIMTCEFKFKGFLPTFWWHCLAVVSIVFKCGLVICCKHFTSPVSWDKNWSLVSLGTSRDHPCFHSRWYQKFKFTVLLSLKCQILLHCFKLPDTF